MLAAEPLQAHHAFLIEDVDDDCEFSEEVSGLWHQGGYGILPAVAFGLVRSRRGEPLDKEFEDHFIDWFDSVAEEGIFEASGGLDPDGNGFFAVEEVWQGIGYLDEIFGEDQAGALFSGAVRDGDGDGQISDEEMD